MSNKAKNSKESIICDAKELMKLYDQPAVHGCEFLGSHIRPNRIHLNNHTFDDALYALEGLSKKAYKDIDKMESVFNSYGGLLKNRTDYGRLIEMKDSLSPLWWQWMEWNENRLCVAFKPEYSVNERLNSKYHLKLKRKWTSKRNNSSSTSSKALSSTAKAA